MKLLKPKTGYWVFGGGNVNTVTTLVEVRWLEFRTGVRFPSSPPRKAACRFIAGGFTFYDNTLYNTFSFNSFANKSPMAAAVCSESLSSACPYCPKVSMLRECPTSDFMVPSGRYFAMETNV